MDNVESMVQVIMACCVLHNIGISGDSEEDLETFYQVAVHQDAIANHNQVAAGLQQPFAAGTGKRREIVEQLAEGRIRQ